MAVGINFAYSKNDATHIRFFSFGKLGIYFAYSKDNTKNLLGAMNSGSIPFNKKVKKIYENLSNLYERRWQ